ncbi:2,4'-dihydroxyacetophenone dioxygenase family protein [Alicyclobacillus shizuokensis]|uniref:2,4'-dihydroxyacetophenone dioxygenase family protein n=1 Tax=Alicyclobacillus shizuokensis TaxID=392014 RepID=UPI00082F7950|nr:2,4'-dihydroxyacetophenone dioxygenase family protein [Alicyclobacillus shizuokensis]
MQLELENYVRVEKRLDKRRDQFALSEGYINASEDASPWIPFVENVWIRHLTFDVRNNSATNVLWVAAGGKLGRHRHRGPVNGYTLEGSWRYLEYDWVAHPGDYVRESPGRCHTLVSESGMKTIFQLNGALEFLDENERIIETVDVFWFIDHYLSYCEAHNLPINERLFL